MAQPQRVFIVSLPPEFFTSCLEMYMPFSVQIIPVTLGQNEPAGSLLLHRSAVRAPILS
jgi:hypothetical protein